MHFYFRFRLWSEEGSCNGLGEMIKMNTTLTDVSVIEMDMSVVKALMENKTLKKLRFYGCLEDEEVISMIGEWIPHCTLKSIGLDLSTHSPFLKALKSNTTLEEVHCLE